MATVIDQRCCQEQVVELGHRINLRYRDEAPSTEPADLALDAALLMSARDAGPTEERLEPVVRTHRCETVRLDAVAALESGLPLAFALTGAEAHERDTALDMIAFSGLDTTGVTLIADKGYWRGSFEHQTQRRRHHPHPTQPQIRTSPNRRPIPTRLSPNPRVRDQTLKAQLDLERHGGRTRQGVAVRILQRILALTAAIWHNETTNRDGPAQSLTPYDH